jgi:hypothetical protein
LILYGVKNEKKLIRLLILSSIGLSATAAEDNLLSNVIVSLDANQIASVADFADGYAISTQYTYNHVFSGFSATVTPKVLARLSNDQRDLSVSNDGTDIAVTVYQPTLKQGQPAPLLMYSHGWGGSRSSDLTETDSLTKTPRIAWESGYFALTFD